MENLNLPALQIYAGIIQLLVSASEDLSADAFTTLAEQLSADASELLMDLLNGERAGMLTDLLETRILLALNNTSNRPLLP